MTTRLARLASLPFWVVVGILLTAINFNSVQPAAPTTRAAHAGRAITPLRSWWRRMSCARKSPSHGFGGRLEMSNEFPSDFI